METFVIHDWEAARITYTGPNGYEWVLSGPGMGEQGVELGRKPRGLYSASGASIWNSGAFQEGATFEGMRWEPRDMVITAQIYGDNGDDWEATYARWVSSWHFDKPGTLSYTSPNGETRTLQVQLYEASQFEPDFDPRLNAYAEMVMTIRSARPWWESAPDFDLWRFDGKNFVGEVTVWNHTDRPLRLGWSLKGPARWVLPDPEIGGPDEHRTVRMPFQRVGWDVTVDTRPEARQVHCNQKANYWALMGGQFFMHEIPPNTPPTKIQVFIDPLPVIPFHVPVEWSEKLARFVTDMIAALPDPAATIFTITPEQLGEWIEDFVRTLTPDFIENLNPELFSELIPENIAGWVVEAVGSLANMAGAEAMVIMPREWMGPWGGDARPAWEEQPE